MTHTYARMHAHTRTRPDTCITDDEVRATKSNTNRANAHSGVSQTDITIISTPKGYSNIISIEYEYVLDYTLGTANRRK